MSQDLAVRIEPDRPAGDQSADRVVVYGDFNCPWSYLASRRAAMLAAAGVEVDWRAVEHDPWRPKRFTGSSTRFDCVQQEMDRVLAALLPGETVPYSLAGFVPYTKAAVSGYAEAYGAGVAARVRQLLFEAFWLHGLDLGAAEPVRTLLVDAIRSGSSASELLSEWGYAVDITGAPLTTDGWRRVRQWRDEWQGTGKEVVPVLLVDGVSPVFGVDAVDWLGAELVRRGVDVSHVPAAVVPTPRQHGLASRSWVSQHGNRWLRDYRRAHARPLFPHAS